MNLGAAILARETGGPPGVRRPRESLPASIARARVAALPESGSSCARTFASVPGCVTSLAFEPLEARLLLVADTRACVRLYDVDAARGVGLARPLASGAPDDARAHARAVTSVAWYTRDGGLFVSGGADGRLVVWDAGSRGGACGGGASAGSGTLRAALRVDLLSAGARGAGGSGEWWGWANRKAS